MSCLSRFKSHAVNFSRAHILLMCHADETEDEDVDNEYVEETNRDAVIIAAAKLVASDTVSKVGLNPVFMNNSDSLLSGVESKRLIFSYDVQYWLQVLVIFLTSCTFSSYAVVMCMVFLVQAG